MAVATADAGFLRPLVGGSKDKIRGIFSELQEDIITSSLDSSGHSQLTSHCILECP